MLFRSPPEPDRRIIAVSHGISGRVLRGLYANLERDATSLQDVPQDAVYLLQHGGIGRIDCEPLDWPEPAVLPARRPDPR